MSIFYKGAKFSDLWRCLCFLRSKLALLPRRDLNMKIVVFTLKGLRIIGRFDDK